MWIAALGLAASSAHALDPTREISQYLVDFWQNGGGLPHNHVFTAIQTRDGYLWVGTRGGLGRFDGVRFTVYDDRRRDQLPDSEVWALAEDREGALWIGTFGGGLIRLRNGTFTRFGEGLPSLFVTSLLATPDGGVWIGTQQGLARIENERITSYKGEKAIPNPYIGDLHLAADGRVWITTEGGLASYARGAFRDHTLENPRLKTRIYKAASDAQGGVWLATWGTGLLHLTPDGRLEQFMAKDGLPSENLLSVHVDPHGMVWAGTAKGVVRYRDGRFESLFTEVVDPGATRTLRTVSIVGVKFIVSDREENIWIGTENDGLVRLRDAVFTAAAVDDPRTEPRVTSVYEDRQHTLWVGVVGGLKREQGGVLVSLPVTSSATSFAEGPDGTFWIATNTGLNRWKSGKLEPVALDKTTIIALAVAPDGTLWIGTRQNGAYSYKDGQLRSLTAADGVPGVQVRGLGVDKKGVVWIGTKDGGLSRWHDGKAQTFTEKEGLSNSSISGVFVDAEDVVWVATRRGLNRIRDGVITTYTSDNGLPANFIYQVTEDGRGSLWLTYSHGVMRIAKSELAAVAAGQATTVSCETFGSESGLRSTSMTIPNQPTAWRRHDGRLVFGSSSGVAIVDPASIARNTLPPPVQIEEVQVDRTAHAPIADAVYPPGRGDFEFHYTALSFVAPERVRFKYRLVGVDRDWIDAGTRRVAYYTQLPPGPYAFQVKACNNDGVWNETGATTSFTLQPHWYQNRAVHVAAIIALGLVLAAGHRYRIAQHERHAKQLKEAADAAVSQAKILRGLLPICASCKKIRDDSGYWNQMETYIHDHSQADFSHSVCPDCLKKLYPEYANQVIDVSKRS